MPTSHSRPMPRAEAGTISIAAGQAAIQSVAGPTGWHVIGSTPALNFLPSREPCFLFDAGDIISFERIDAEAWRSLRAAALRGEPVARRIA